MSSLLKKKLPLIMAAAAVVSLIGAVLMFIFPVLQATVPYKRTLGIIIMILMLALSALAWLYLWLGRDKEPNFFLFDRQKKRNISVDDLTFTAANERLTFLLTAVSESVEELWQENVLENESKLGYRKVYRPLIAYKMLYDLGDKNIESYWACLENASDEMIASIAGALEQAGEKEMPKAFSFIMTNYRGDSEKIRSFIAGNGKYIRGRIMAYIKRNIELFY